MKAHWRVIKSPASTGAYNMALDEILLSLSSRKEIPPTLRFYSWDPPTLSLGYAQKAADVDSIKLKNQGWDLVRRPTGGRAILHVDELTYSITAPVDDPLMSGTLLESYQRISSILQKALEDLGVNSSADKEYPKVSKLSKNNPICFEVPSNFEITHNEKKLIGSAQARKSGGVLQHGSLPLYGDLSRITHVLNYPTQEAQQLAAKRILDRATTLAEAAGRCIKWQDAVSSFIDAFSKHMDVILDESEVTTLEKNAAEVLVRTKYDTQDWNYRL